MLRVIYICLLRLHPRHFQLRHADEMLWIFDESGKPARLIADAALSLIRQWLVRPEPQPARAVPLFATIADGPLPHVRLLQGALATLMLFTLLVFGFGRGGAIGWRNLQPAIANTLYVGRNPLPIPSVLRQPQQSTSVVGALWLRFLGSSAQPTTTFTTPILRALDRDTDGKLSPEEIAQAPQSLAALDQDANGFLDPQECGLPLVTGLSPDRLRLHEKPTGGLIRHAFFLYDSVLRALDQDRDGRLSPAELTASPAALRALDLNRDGALTLAELQ